MFNFQIYANFCFQICTFFASSFATKMTPNISSIVAPYFASYVAPCFESKVMSYFATISTPCLDSSLVRRVASFLMPSFTSYFSTTLTPCLASSLAPCVASFFMPSFHISHFLVTNLVVFSSFIYGFWSFCLVTSLVENERLVTRRPQFLVTTVFFKG